RVIHKKNEIPVQKKFELKNILKQLLEHCPIQYVLHEAWFMGMKLYVDENVLIPRPETEELVEWLLAEWNNTYNKKISVLDVGTGSGCIPIALKKKMPLCEISGCDVSKGALGVAQRNISNQNVSVRLFELDFLDPSQRNSLPSFDSIISNPPYIPKKDIDTLEKHVSDFEPHLALFVPDSDPTVFYSAIREFSSTHLNPGGNIYLELHEDLSEQVLRLFRQTGFSAPLLKKDIHGKNRMLKVTKI
ncbi:MAG TPA: peptide chain release factor N(5)-glutamine methyltransferase, partial [Puia sp.]|nr:peptide chain release factor N(5)-glutamine methyltransferase [Puia sp.]